MFHLGRLCSFISILAVCSLTACTKTETFVPFVQKDVQEVDQKINTWLSTNNIPGASIAISKNGQLVYRKGFGKANITTGETVNTQSRFRIGSASKAVTSIAILKLMQEGRLRMNQTVFGYNGILGIRTDSIPNVAWINAITIEDLLKHTAGGWLSRPNDDAAFYNYRLNANELINYVVRNSPTQYAPGNNFCFSNFGYVVLARVIEKLSGKPYERYIKEEVLNYIGAFTVVVGGNTYANILDNEVTYKGQGDDGPFVYANNNYARADGSLGLVSTPTDLLRMVCAVDGFNTKADILNNSSIQAMITGSAGNDEYGCGWRIDDGVWTCSSTMPGSTSFLYRDSKGFCIAFLANSRLQPNPALALNEIMNAMQQVVQNNSITWQQNDQF